MSDLERYWATAGFRRALPRIGLPEDSDLPLAELALLLSLSGERAAAADAYREVLEGAPDDVDTMEKLAGVLGRLGRTEEQADLFRRIAATVSDKLGVPTEQRDAVIQFEAAARGIAEPPPAAPPDFVARTFDVYADTFEGELRYTLKYRGPEQIAARIQRVFGDGDRTLAVCDAGCGTGVLGPFLRPYARCLEGVDLSPRMLEKARATDLYDALHVAELAAHLDARAKGARAEGTGALETGALKTSALETGAFDIVTAADVFVYVGDLLAVFRSVANALKRGGHFFCTVEQAPGDGYVLNFNGRYAHSAHYLRRVAEEAGLAVVSIEEEELRRERRSAVLSWVAAFAKRGEVG